jgi:hypothetical protein
LPCRSTRGNAFFVELADPEPPLGAPDADIASGAEKEADREEGRYGKMRM